MQRFKVWLYVKIDFALSIPFPTFVMYLKQNNMSTFKSDPDNYYKMSQPHKDADAANEAVAKFFELVSQARNECKIADVIVTIQDTTHYQGGIGQFTAISHYGDIMNKEAMAAYTLGKMQAERKELINKLSNQE